MTNDISRKYFRLLNQILLLLYSLISFAILAIGAFYSNPNTEEFSLCQEPRDLGWKEGILHMLVHFDGRYFTNFLHAFNPLAFDWINGYKLMPVAGILLFISAGYFLFSQFVKKESRLNLLLLVAVVAFLHFQLSTSLPSQLYWMAGSFVYLWPWTFMFLWLGCYFRFIESDSIFKLISRFIFTLLFLFCALGLSEMFLAANAIILFAVLVSSYLTKKKFSETLLVTVFGISCMLLFVTSPGIRIRAAEYRMEGLPLISIPNLLKGFFDNILVAKNIFFNPMLILAALALFPVLKNIRARASFFLEQGGNSIKALQIALLLVIIAYLMSLSYYIPMQTDTGLPVRIYTATALLLIAAAILSYWVVLNFFDGYLERKTFFKARPMLQLIFPVTLILCTFIVHEGNNFWKILVDYKSGVMTNFDADMRDRYKILSDTKMQTGCYKIAVLDSITNYPESIFYGPTILSNRSYPFGNESWETYFGVDEIMLEGDTLRKYKL